MPQGTIKKVLVEKGFGFISPISGGNELFFHHTALVDTTIEELGEGQAVEYDIESSEKGPRAGSVRLVSRPTDQ